LNIGILSLQGNYDEHYKKIKDLDVNAFLVKKNKDLIKCDGLIIPGGESTTMSKMIDFLELRKTILELKDKINIMGTCAGMIMLSNTKKYSNLKTLSLMDFEVERNGWGRQINSFTSKINLSFSDKETDCTFIRAPKVIKYNKKKIKCLAKMGTESVLLTDGKHIASSFHPEYSNGYDLYNYFFSLIKKV
jgi:5'-phosphate synthase pdxT subunit|tara:strand:+ start:19 stop:588 length:570 start_codon:yes stop_codon:yes gene_type:complete